jgi:alpha-L-rhamnosidase
MIRSVLLLVTALASPLRADVRVDSLACEGTTNPLGIGTGEPRLSWIVRSERRADRQSAYQVLVATSVEMLAQDAGDLWDSGKVESGESIQVPYAGTALGAARACHWKVRVWDADDAPSGWSEPATFETGLLAPGDWLGQWINDGRANPPTDADMRAEDPAPLFRKEFMLPAPVRRARLHIAGLGYYGASINARRVGTDVLEPLWTNYARRVYSRTYDVTSSLFAGPNCIGVSLGNGWYNPLPLRMWGRLNLREHLTVGRPRFIAQLVVECEDGSGVLVTSDTTWTVAEGPLRFNNIYLGEVHDARLERTGWDTAGYDDHAWGVASLAPEPLGPLEPAPAPPVRAFDRFPAVARTEPAPGVHIYDMGENFAGWASVRMRVPAGTAVVLRYGELLNPDGTLNPLTSVAGQIKGSYKDGHGVEHRVGGAGSPEFAWQTDTYIAKGEPDETYTPRFAFHAYRYVEITGLPAPLALNAVMGDRLHADVRSVGTFECSDDRLNRIQAMCRRTFLSNIFGVQSDCPHRERFGYGGDIAATSDAFLLNFDMSRFYAKTVQDFADAARPDGMLTDTAPFVGIQYCGVGWAMAHPLLLTQLVRYNADRRLVEQQYDVARRWLLLVASQNPTGIINDGLGDHESLEPTPSAPLVTPLYVASARMLARMARLMGKPEDEAAFDDIAEKAVQAYRAAFVDPSGKVGDGTQAMQSIALAHGLVPDQLRPQAVQHLLDNINGPRKGHLSTGIMGTRCLLDTLSREGHADTAYAIVTRPDFPGWGWMLANNATTLWEHWALDANTFSHNHPMFGSVSEWMFKWVGGVQPADDAVGFHKLVIRPQFIAGLDWVKCTYESVRGTVRSEWRRDAGTIVMHVEVPVGAVAEVWVPARDAREAGVALGQAPDIRVVRSVGDRVVCEVPAGRYEFSGVLE